LSGPTGAGKKTVSKVLADKYGWKIVDWNQLITSKINMMRDRDDVLLPNNPLAEDYKLGLSEEEWNVIREGTPFDAFNYMPWFYEFMGHETEKRRPPPKAEGEGEGEMDEETKAKHDEELLKKEEEEKKKEKEKEKEKKKKEKEKKDKKKNKNEDVEAEGEGEEEEEEEPLEDINLSDLDLKILDEEKLTKPFVGGFILIGFPQTAEHIEKLKTSGMGFDKIIYLQDTDEENPGALLEKRMKRDEFYNLANELENGEKVLGIYKEIYDEIVNEVS
jgi:adenylate kinase family enzyme